MTFTLKNLTTKEELQQSFAAFKALRPALNIEQFLTQVDLQRTTQNYCALAVEVDTNIVAVAGYRIANYLAWGKVLYIDDLSTLPEHRGNGYASALLSEIQLIAKAAQCDAVHLDSGHHRHAAHKAYLKQGFEISSHHFSLKLTD